MPTLQAGHIMLLGVFARPFSNRMWEHAKIPVIELFELHDAFSIMAALSLEACGFAARAQGPRLALDGEICPTGRIPISTPGGLNTRGNPVGATGVYQIAEIVQQLCGDAGKNQIPDARVGMAQNIGGSGLNIVRHIIRNVWSLIHLRESRQS